MMLDRRLNAYRDDLADETLRDRVKASHYTQGSPGQISTPLSNLHLSASHTSRIGSQLLYGETVRVFDTRDGWSWVQADRDRYVGYVRDSEVTSDVMTSTHRVAVPSTHLYGSPNIKEPPTRPLFLNSVVAVARFDGEFAELTSGEFVFATHLLPLDAKVADPVSIAEEFLNAPYLWGGRSFAGIDCSGLVQMARLAAGLQSPRDTDMLEMAGERLPSTAIEGNTDRGLLLFWPGHVAMTVNGTQIIHASGHAMKVLIENREAAIARIAAKGIHISSIQRL